MKTDAYTHFVPRSFFHFLDAEMGGAAGDVVRPFAAVRSLWSVEERLGLMDAIGMDQHVLVPPPVVDMIPALASDPQRAVRAARLYNTELSEIASQAPDRLFGVALLPSTSAESMVEELQFAVRELGLLGGVVGVAPTLKPTDHPDYQQLYAAAAQLDVPIWLHPARSPKTPDVDGETHSRYGYWQAFGWLSDDTLAMVRIALSGVFVRHPGIKIIVHHVGGMVPVFGERLDVGVEFFESCAGVSINAEVSPPYLDQLRHFWVDTATHGENPLLVQAAVDFFGIEHVLFGSDAPMDASGGKRMASAADKSVDNLALTQPDKNLIYSGNFQSLIGKT